MNRIRMMVALFVLLLGAGKSIATEVDLPVGIADFPFLTSGVKPDEFKKTGRLEIIDASTVKVWLSTISPNVPLKFHRHLTGRLIIPLQDVQLTKNYDKKSGRKAEVMVWKRGQAYFYDADEMGLYHNDENKGAAPLQVLVVAFRENKEQSVLEVMPGQ